MEKRVHPVSHRAETGKKTGRITSYNVCYTKLLRWGGMSFAILEDRKFKTGPAILDHRKVKNPLELDVPEAELLGQRQIDFRNNFV